MESDNDYDYEIKFNGINDYYQIDSDIECVIKINDSFKPNVKTDFIALQKDHVNREAHVFIKILLNKYFRTQTH
jgi:hypothetical protein